MWLLETIQIIWLGDDSSVLFLELPWYLSENVTNTHEIYILPLLGRVLVSRIFFKSGTIYGCLQNQKE